MNCTLCESKSDKFFNDEVRTYFHCNCCDLVFADPGEYLSKEDERERYDLHQNDPDDPRYRLFLNKLVEPLLGFINNTMIGLDYGSGPGSTLHLMLQEAGYNMSIYDPYYAPDKSVLNIKYDFVTCSEVVEHFYNPSLEWKKLVSLVKKGGLLGIMTKQRDDNLEFSKWHYKDDPTHVSFYSKKTFEWISKTYILELNIVNKEVVLLGLI
jgi:hypothetical protein